LAIALYSLRANGASNTSGTLGAIWAGGANGASNSSGTLGTIGASNTSRAGCTSWTSKTLSNESALAVHLDRDFYSALSDPGD
jgi:hypothetical protein